MVEVPCELPDKIICKTDMFSFKGYVHRWMAQTALLAPFTYDRILAALKNSTANAVKSCSGGENGRTCGFRWTTGGYDGWPGAGQQMNALAALSSLLIETEEVEGPVTSKTGGSGKTNPNAGAGRSPFEPPVYTVETKDRVGAGLITAFMLTGFLGALVWMAVEGTGGSTLPPGQQDKEKGLLKGFFGK